MGDPFLGEIKTVGFNFAPRGFAVCNGQIMQIQQNTALFAILGTSYGGNGSTTYALPDLQATTPMHWGAGPGLTPRTVGERAGAVQTSLGLAELPSHAHVLNAAALNPPNTAQNVPAPTAQAMIGPSNPNMAFSDTSTPSVSLSPSAIGMTGGSQPHENRQPLLALTFVIALQGIFPSRN
ncbi:phage tail protein [Sphingomonas faeni]|uniref:phage tail protein n=1 Tax=Sphingomonas faeni TaxID=185950 RepID=UPI00334D5E54